MKKVITITLLLIISASISAQTTEPDQPVTKAEYLKKSRTQRIAGFVMLGSGAAILIGVSGGNTDLNSLGTLVVVGAGLVIGSIPLFIAAGKNKRRYNNATATLKFEETQLITQKSTHIQYIPAVGLKIRL